MGIFKGLMKYPVGPSTDDVLLNNFKKFLNEKSELKTLGRQREGYGKGTGRVRVLSTWLSGRAYDPQEPSEHLHSGPFFRCKIRVLSFLLKTGNELRRLKPQQHVNMTNRLSWPKKNKVYISI